MLEKNKAKLERKNRKMWTGLYTRKTPTKKEKIRKLEKKYKESANSRLLTIIQAEILTWIAFNYIRLTNYTLICLVDSWCLDYCPEEISSSSSFNCCLAYSSILSNTP